MHKDLLKIFTIVSMVLYLILLPFIEYPITTLLKPIPIIFLIVFVLSYNLSVTNTVLVIALVFSALGDILLTIPVKTAILGGIASFMMTHCLYSYIFLKNGNIEIKRTVYFLPVFAIVIALFCYVWPSLGEMKMPALIYVLLLAFMVFCSFQVKQYMLLISSGAIIFVISDFLVALELFILPNNLGLKFSIMFLYYLAQFVLVTGTVKLIGR